MLGYLFLSFSAFGLLSSSFILYIHNFSTDAFFSILQVFHIELGSLHEILKLTLYSIYGSRVI